MLKLVMKTEIDGQIPVEMFRTTYGYAVRYGLHITRHAPFEEAMHEFTSCATHAVRCAGYGEEE